MNFKNFLRGKISWNYLILKNLKKNKKGIILSFFIWVSSLLYWTLKVLGKLIVTLAACFFYGEWTSLNIRDTSPIQINQKAFTWRFQRENSLMFIFKELKNYSLLLTRQFKEEKNLLIQVRWRMLSKMFFLNVGRRTTLGYVKNPDRLERNGSEFE